MEIGRGEREGGWAERGGKRTWRSMRLPSQHVSVTHMSFMLTHLLGPHHGVLPDHPLALAVSTDVEVQRVVTDVPRKPQFGELHALNELRGGGHEHLHVPACRAFKQYIVKLRCLNGRSLMVLPINTVDS